MADSTVFVSSTCYDLIDLRWETEAFLRETGFSPVLSDIAISEFHMDPTIDSIETCLTNVRASDIFMMVLSARYGPSLKKAGFEDISATHLEYREAKKEGKPIFVYARDLLLGAWSHWKKQRRPEKFQSSWIDSQNLGLFHLLDEHSTLTAGAGSNWVQPFRASTDLKEILRRDLRATRPSAILQRLIDQNKTPEIRMHCIMASQPEYDLIFENFGAVTALRVAVRFIGETQGVIGPESVALALPPGQKFQKKAVLVGFQTSLAFAAEVLYELADGTQIGELFHCGWKGAVPNFVHMGKWHIGESTKVFPAPFYPWKVNPKK